MISFVNILFIFTHVVGFHHIPIPLNKHFAHLFRVYEQPKWLQRDDREEVIYKDHVVYDSETPLFDIVHKQTEKGSFHTLSTYSLKDISESYKLSLSYLGDFVIQLGCQPPVDIDLPIGEYLLGEQIYSLIEAVTSLDPLESNLDYDSIDIEQFAEEYNVPSEIIFDICIKEKFNLPFGKDTTLHISEIQRLKDILETLSYGQDLE